MKLKHPKTVSFFTMGLPLFLESLDKLRTREMAMKVGEKARNHGKFVGLVSSAFFSIFQHLLIQLFYLLGENYCLQASYVRKM